jgi:hypothetical protein
VTHSRTGQPDQGPRTTRAVVFLSTSKSQPQALQCRAFAILTVSGDAQRGQGGFGSSGGSAIARWYTQIKTLLKLKSVLYCGAFF